ncbi:hypothetical protein [Nocardia sp. NPDC051750]|uniref:hypothetical protein n=1 Tax=Nocardia sp. NPDC051750 TaxID=3364325 RepID=UPI0037BA383C
MGAVRETKRITPAVNEIRVSAHISGPTAAHISGPTAAHISGPTAAHISGPTATEIRQRAGTTQVSISGPRPAVAAFVTQPEAIDRPL